MWADASLATGGIAIDQLISMVNYVLRLDVGTTGQTAQLLVDTHAFGTRTVDWSNTMVQGAGPNIPLFDQHGELDLYNAATHTGTLTGQYLADRATMLAVLIQRNMADSTNA